MGNIDLVLVAFDNRGRVVDFGALEVQAVYISGNVRLPFEKYMEDPAGNYQMTWQSKTYPRADYLSSSRKRLLPQLLTKGSIVRSWGKKQAVALDRQFFSTLPPLTLVDPTQAEMAWLVYDLVYDEPQMLYNLQLEHIYHTDFQAALDRMVLAAPGPVEGFLDKLQARLDRKLGNQEHPPDTSTLEDLV